MSFEGARCEYARETGDGGGSNVRVAIHLPAFRATGCSPSPASTDAALRDSLAIRAPQASSSSSASWSSGTEFRSEPDSAKPNQIHELPSKLHTHTESSPPRQGERSNQP